MPPSHRSQCRWKDGGLEDHGAPGTVGGVASAFASPGGFTGGLLSEACGTSRPDVGFRSPEGRVPGWTFSRPAGEKPGEEWQKKLIKKTEFLTFHIILRFFCRFFPVAIFGQKAVLPSGFGRWSSQTSETCKRLLLAQSPESWVCVCYMFQTRDPPHGLG